jgi:hypothetical protein
MAVMSCGNTSTKQILLRRRKEGKNARRDVVASPINFP